MQGLPSGVDPRRMAEEEGRHWHLRQGCQAGKEEGTFLGDQMMVLRVPQNRHRVEPGFGGGEDRQGGTGGGGQEIGN